jgi:hypothetical protein
MKNCSRCNSTIHEERLKILPSTHLCTACARRLPVQRKMGAMVFSHKTAPTIQIMDGDFYKSEWSRYQSKFGMGSGVHKMSPRSAGSA